MNALRSASGHPVSHIAFAPDGSAFAAAQPHSGVTLHDRVSGAAIRTAGSDRVGEYRGLVYLDGGAVLVASMPKGLEVFDVANEMKSVMYHRHGKNALLAADGRAVVAAWATGVERVEFGADAAPSESRAVWQSNAGALEGLSPCGRYVASVPRTSRVAVHDLRHDREVATAKNTWTKMATLVTDARGQRLPPGPERVVFAPRGDRFAARNGKTVTVFDLPADDEPEGDDDETEADAPPPHGVMRAVFRVPAPDRWPKGEPWNPPLAFTPCGRRLLVRRPRQQVQMWDVASGTALTEWNWRLDAVTCLAVAPDGLTAVAGGRFGRVVVWDLE